MTCDSCLKSFEPYYGAPLAVTSYRSSSVAFVLVIATLALYLHTAPASISTTVLSYYLRFLHSIRTQQITPGAPAASSNASNHFL